MSKQPKPPKPPKPPKVLFVPTTPGGTPVFNIAAKTEAQAWANLLKDAAHMPYKTIEGFKARGYTIDQYEELP